MNPNSFDVIDGLNTYKLFINGTWHTSSRNALLDCVNPANGEVFARSYQASDQDVDDAIAAADAAQQAWGETLVAERETMLYRIGEVIADRRSEIQQVLIEECGSVFGKALWEIEYVEDAIRSAAGDVRRVMGETMPMTMPGQMSISVRKPLGVIAGIAPFNSPFLLAMKKVVYALGAGNAFVLKPSEETPVSGAIMADLCADAGLPAGLLNVVPGVPAQVGDRIMADPRVKMITFTGSTNTGRHLAVEAAKNLKKFTLEMGGKSPLVVLKDADIDYAVDAAVWGVFLHQGQVCMAGSKVIVEAEIFEQFRDKFVAKTETLKVGDPREPDTVIGPLIRARQCPFIDGHVSDAVSKGAILLTGGTHDGRTYQPTVLAGVTPEMRIYTEETFGPVVSLIEAADSEEALAIANDTAYGLSAAVITNDLQKAMDFSQRMEAGMVHVNDCTISDEPHVPFGGIKNSGFGREGGRYSMEELTEVKWVTIQLGKREFSF